MMMIARGTKSNRSIADINEIEEDETDDQGCYLDMKEGAGNLVSAQTLQGRILVSSTLPDI